MFQLPWLPPHHNIKIYIHHTVHNLWWHQIGNHMSCAHIQGAKLGLGYHGDGWGPIFLYLLEFANCIHGINIFSFNGFHDWLYFIKMQIQFSSL